MASRDLMDAVTNPVLLSAMSDTVMASLSAPLVVDTGRRTGERNTVNSLGVSFRGLGLEFRV
jgi:hypothetical protein